MSPMEEGYFSWFKSMHVFYTTDPGPQVPGLQCKWSGLEIKMVKIVLCKSYFVENGKIWFFADKYLVKILKKIGIL